MQPYEIASRINRRMEQMTTFNEYRVSNVLNKDGTVNYYGKILSSEKANRYFDLLMQNIQWEKESHHFW